MVVGEDSAAWNGLAICFCLSEEIAPCYQTVTDPPPPPIASDGGLATALRVTLTGALYRRQRLVQIGQQIVDVLNTT